MVYSAMMHQSYQLDLIRFQGGSNPGEGMYHGVCDVSISIPKQFLSTWSTGIYYL